MGVPPLPHRSGYRRWRLAVVFGFLVLLLGGILFFGNVSEWQRPWKQWRSRSYVDRAVHLLDKGATEAAQKACQRALLLDHDNVGAYRLLLGIPRQSRDAILLARARIADLAPGDLDNLHELARESLAAGREGMASRALAALVAGEGETGRATELLAQIHYACRQWPMAAQAAKKWLLVNPANEQAKLIASVAAVESSDTDALPEAIDALKEMGRTPLHSIVVARTLRNHYARQGDLPEALVWAKKAADDPRCAFDDRLARADLDCKIAPEKLEAAAAEIRRHAGNDPHRLFMLTTWLETTGRPGLPADSPSAVNSLPVVIAEAGRLAGEKNWEGLRLRVEAPGWGAAETLRLAYLARAMNGLERKTEARAQWDKAVEEALRNPDHARAVAGIAGRWPEWTDYHEALLWKIHGRFPELGPWSLERLGVLYGQKQSAGGLLRVSREALRLQPNSDAVRNNYAFFLLLQGVSMDQADRIARELAAKHPADPVIQSTFALSLAIGDSPKEALDILDRLPAEYVKRDSVSLVRAIALVKTGRNDEAREVAGGIKREKLFREERSLLEENGL